MSIIIDGTAKITKGIRRIISISNNKKIRVIIKKDKEYGLREDLFEVIPLSKGLSLFFFLNIA